MRYKCRCSNCLARKTLRKHPDQYSRSPECWKCQGKCWRVDKFRQSGREGRYCYCDAIKWGPPGCPHKWGIKGCVNRDERIILAGLAGRRTSEDDEFLKPFRRHEMLRLTGVDTILKCWNIPINREPINPSKFNFGDKIDASATSFANTFVIGEDNEKVVLFCPLNKAAYEVGKITEEYRNLIEQPIQKQEPSQDLYRVHLHPELEDADRS